MKFITMVFAFVLAIVVAGCDGKKEVKSQVDLSNDPHVSAMLNDNEDDSYGNILHKAVVADEVIVQNVKMSGTLHAYTIGMRVGKNKFAVSYVCDLRTKGGGFVHNLEMNDGVVPKGDFGISMMNYAPDVTSIREADDLQDPVFSTTNGESDYIGSLKRLKQLTKNSTVAFTIDKEEEGEEGAVAIAWSPLMKVGDLLVAMEKAGPTPCEGVPAAVDEQHVFGQSKEDLAALKK